MAKLEIKFDVIDFWPILERKGINPETVTDYEWGKFTDSFLDGTYWSEVAEMSCDRIIELRQEKT